MNAQEKLGRFGHHPDPVIDFEVEIGAIEGDLYEVRAGAGDVDATYCRTSIAMATVWISDDGQKAKDYLRRIVAEHERAIKGDGNE